MLAIILTLKLVILGIDAREDTYKKVVLFALQMCREIDLYGFSNYNRHESDGARKGKTHYHYFDSVPGTTKVHSFDLSLEVFKLMNLVHTVRVK